MKIVQSKTSTIRATGLVIEIGLPDYEKIRKELQPGIDLMLAADTRKIADGTEITLFGYFDHEKFCKTYGNDAFCGFLEKLQEITQSRLIIDTIGNDYTITIYDDYIE